MNKERTADPDFSNFYEEIQSQDKHLSSLKPEISASQMENMTVPYFKEAVFVCIDCQQTTEL